MELDPQAVINELSRQRNEALDRCAILVSELVMLKKENETLSNQIESIKENDDTSNRT